MEFLSSKEMQISAKRLLYPEFGVLTQRRLPREEIF